MDKTLPDDKVLPKGHKSCLSEGFKYTPAANTDLKKTFARVRREIKKQKPSPDNVHDLRTRRSS